MRELVIYLQLGLMKTIYTTKKNADFFGVKRTKGVVFWVRKVENQIFISNMVYDIAQNALNVSTNLEQQ